MSSRKRYVGMVEIEADLFKETWSPHIGPFHCATGLNVQRRFWHFLIPLGTLFSHLGKLIYVPFGMKDLYTNLQYVAAGNGHCKHEDGQLACLANPLFQTLRRSSMMFACAHLPGKPMHKQHSQRRKVAPPLSVFAKDGSIFAALLM